MVGTRSRAIRRRTSKEGAHLKTGEADGQEPQLREPKRAFAEAAKRSVERAAPDARERIPAPAERSATISSVQTNASTITRNKGLLVSPRLELFFDF